MPFVEQAIADAKEGHLCSEGRHDLRTIKADLKKSKDGSRDIVQCTILAEDEDENCIPITHVLVLTLPDDEYANLHLVGQKRFFEAFKIPYEDNGFDPEDIPGHSASGIMVRHAPNEGDPENPYTRLDLPRLPDEDDEEQEPKKGKRKRRAAA